MSSNISIIDSHAHLDYPQLANDLPTVLARANEVGVSQVITIGVKLSSSDVPKNIADTYDNVWCSVGIHPHEVQNEPNAFNVDAIHAAADHPKCVAIGEAGLDYHYDNSNPVWQASSFRAQISAARNMGLPIIIHSRDADEDMKSILKEEMKLGNFTGVMHCFSSGAELAKCAVDLGLYISFSGIITFKKSDELRSIAANVPLNRVIVETDAPYLAPMPHRGKPNEPAFTIHTLQKLADIHGLSIKEMAAITSTNTKKLFSKMVFS